MPITAFAKPITATVASGATDSSVIDVRGARKITIIIPSAITGTTMTYKVHPSKDAAGTPLYTAANALVSQTIAVSRAYPLDVTGISFLSLVFASQAAARTIAITAS